MRFESRRASHGRHALRKAAAHGSRDQLLRHRNAAMALVRFDDLFETQAYLRAFAGYRDMTANILTAIGGLGLFLVGMTMLTEGLRALAGNRLRRSLAYYTNSPVSGAVSGAVATAIVQSSSATTLAAIGFVGAGLMTFPQALGVVFGANIGTTATGWLVALLGFKLKLDAILMPVVFVGVVLRMFGPVTLKNAGWSLAGFGILFAGISAMQQGMAGMDDLVALRSLPADTVLGRLQLVLLGVVLTAITQSSSAGVVAALVALSAGAISFSQAAAMVIGMNVGTTFTAAVAVLGGSTAMRRTGYAHVVYNVVTGIAAFALMPLYTDFIEQFVVNGGERNAHLALVAFHTGFNLVGVTVFVIFARPFAHFIERIVPERGPPLVGDLDSRLLKEPAAAADAAVASIGNMSIAAFAILADALRPHDEKPRALSDLETVTSARREVLGFVSDMHTNPSQPVAHQRHLAAMHALDHLHRLIERCRQTDRLETLRSEPRLRQFSRQFLDLVDALASPAQLADAVGAADDLRKHFRKTRHEYRQATLVQATRGYIDDEIALRRLDAIR
ncbi:MAG: Na/Pi cotransporter family protein, partial [Hyphomicrobiales bacterium]|nr:Na/Pi cotransporter family protein [Hyphomicrobiales bacterium]